MQFEIGSFENTIPTMASRHHSHKYNICKYALFSTNPPMWCHKINNSVQPADSTLVSTEIIKDILHCRDSYNYSFFKLHEINTILLTVCTA